jgi:hypothetical protein
LVDTSQNLLNQISFTSDDLVNFLVNTSCIISEKRSKAVEWETTLPSFTNYFYDYIINSQTLISQTSFFQKYYYTYINKFVNFKKYDIECLRGRLYRAYPSLVRDLHFNLVAKELFGDKAFYSLSLDQEYKIDSLLLLENKKIGFELFINTQNSLHSRQVKKDRPKLIDESIEVVECSLHDGKILFVGSYFLYDAKSILKDYICM